MWIFALAAKVTAEDDQISQGFLIISNLSRLCLAAPFIYLSIATEVPLSTSTSGAEQATAIRSTHGCVRRTRSIKEAANRMITNSKMRWFNFTGKIGME